MKTWAWPVVLALSRIGKVAAATTATTLIDAFGAQRLLFTGVAGGLGSGVRVGDVTEISVRYDGRTDSFAIPVIAELDDDAVRGLEGRFSHDDIGHALPLLIKRGLTAQLGTQSLVTGQLYVDLDFRSKPPGVLHGGYEGDATEIPTSATAPASSRVASSARPKSVRLMKK